MTRTAVQANYQLADLRNWAAISSAQKIPIRLGVVGDPVAHSRSPAMQNAALAAAGLTMRYARFRIAPNELAEALRLMRAHDFIGLNLTLPHKLAAGELVDELDETAKAIGAINTVVFRKGRSLGCNTDAEGFSRAIREEFSVSLADLRVLLLGLGGAGRGVAFQCASENCPRIVLVNRTPEKAERVTRSLHEHFPGSAARISAIPWDEKAFRRELERVDLVINATSMGLRETDPCPLDSHLLTPRLLICDLIPGPTPLLRAAAKVGARSADGLTMLLHQGALAFEKWFDRAAPIDEMRRALVDEIA